MVFHSHMSSLHAKPISSLNFDLVDKPCGDTIFRNICNKCTKPIVLIDSQTKAIQFGEAVSETINEVFGA
jgi:hypothetical protein